MDNGCLVSVAALFFGILDWGFSLLLLVAAALIALCGCRCDVICIEPTYLYFLMVVWHSYNSRQHPSIDCYE